MEDIIESSFKVNINRYNACCYRLMLNNTSAALSSGSNPRLEPPIYKSLQPILQPPFPG